MAKVLIVDDDKLLMKMLSEALGQRSYEVITAENGQEGLESILENKPDAVLLDISMPVMNGLEMLKELRKTSDLPVIMISAYGSEENVEKARNLGIECFLNKPFDMDVLADMLDVIFNVDTQFTMQDIRDLQ